MGDVGTFVTLLDNIFQIFMVAIPVRQEQNQISSCAISRNYGPGGTGGPFFRAPHNGEHSCLGTYKIGDVVN